MKKSIILTILFFSIFSIFSEENNYSVLIQGVQAAEKKYTEVKAYHILVPTEKEALSIREQILSADDRMGIFSNFREAARKYSTCPSGKDGGGLNWFGKGEMVPEFEKAAFNLPNGQVSEPIKTQFGWHLIYVSAKR